MVNSRHNQIKKIVQGSPCGSVFAISDFSGIAVPETASKVLIRLCRAGMLTKVVRGVFMKPKDDGEGAFDPVARAIARSNGWRTAPAGKTALYLSGLISEKPAVWTYITDGTYREYHCLGGTIKLCHVSGKLIKMSEKSAMLVQIIKNYRRDRLNDETKDKLRALVEKNEWGAVVAETRNTTGWIAKAVRALFGIKPGKNPV